MSTPRMRLRVLFVAPYEPSDLAVRSRLFLQAMSERHEVDVVTLRRAGPGVCEELGERRYHAAARLRDRVSALRRLRDDAYPLQCVAAASGRVRAAVTCALRSDAYDLVHVEHIRALQYLPERVDVPMVFDAVDCVSALFDAAAPHQRHMLQRLFRAEGRRIARLERQWCPRAACVLVASQRDADALLARCPGADIAVLTNPVDLRRFRPGPPERRARVVMTGKMSFHANRVAAEWLCTSIWPLVRAQCPDAQLLIAGAHPPASLRRFTAAGIEITGFVDDLGDVLRDAAVAVAPLRYAMGVQNKVLEAMATATPVVATPVALGGIAAVPGRDVLLGASAAEIASRIVLLLRNPWLARRIAAAGRHFVESEHAPGRIAAQLESHLLEVAAAAATGASRRLHVASGS